MPAPPRRPSRDARSGYSGTPLAQKLGIGADMRVHVRRAPPGYRALLAPIPSGVRFSRRADATTALVHLFETQRARLVRELATLRGTLAPTAAVWVSWPKRSAGVASEISEGTIRDVALPLGFVDVKVCAVDVRWSGLKLVVRRELRPALSS